nr:uncharacterized protein LOC123283809 [Equus asinus]
MGWSILRASSNPWGSVRSAGPSLPQVPLLRQQPIACSRLDPLPSLLGLLSGFQKVKRRLIKVSNLAFLTCPPFLPGLYLHELPGRPGRHRWRGLPPSPQLKRLPGGASLRRRERRADPPPRGAVRREDGASLPPGESERARLSGSAHLRPNPLTPQTAQEIAVRTRKNRPGDQGCPYQMDSGIFPFASSRGRPLHAQNIYPPVHQG